MTEKEREVKNRRKLNELNAGSKGVRFNPTEHNKKIFEFTEQDYFRLFFKKAMGHFFHFWVQNSGISLPIACPRWDIIRLNEP